MEAIETVELEHANLAQHQSSIVQQMRNFWMENHLCDVVLKGNDGVEHCAHTALLSAASVVFRNLLGGSFLEANQVQRKQPVEIPASKASVSALLDYIYGGQPKIDLETGLELLHLAEAYDLPKLARAIEAGLLLSLDGVKALRVLQEAHGLHGLKATCEEKVAESFETCSQHPDFGKISAIQLARILKREDLKVSREEVVFKGIFNWFSFSKERHGLLGMLLQHVDFESFSADNLLRVGRFTLSGPAAEELHRNVDEALQRQRKRAQSTPNSLDFQPKRRCLKHWSPGLGASAAACWRKVLPIQCHSLSWHRGHIYATDFEGNVLCWHPGDPATSVRKVVGGGVGTTGTNDMGSSCDVSVSPSGEIFVLDFEKDRLVRFQDGCGHLVCGDLSTPRCLSCSPSGVLYWVVEEHNEGRSQVWKLVGSTLQTVIASESLPEDLQFRATAIFVTKDEVIYIFDCLFQQRRILRINPSESLKPIVVGQIPLYTGGGVAGVLRNLWNLFVTEDDTIYVSDHDAGKVFAVRPGDTTCSQTFQCPDSLFPVALLVQDRSLYVGVVDDYDAPDVVGVYEHLPPPELQLE
ncbi:KLHL24 [Symbiodinium natans]|uniref:KLHL24 protein n=1 Tax=Symbiodinium natans TaxID=878477 RepID=A0A812PBT8_9DINO|nr:KLHL24 [Symbiodinium natans]